MTDTDDSAALASTIGLVWGLLDAGRIEPAETLVAASLRLWPGSEELQILAAMTSLAASRPDALDELDLPEAGRWHSLLQPLRARAARLTTPST
jgi:hypothetical protein